tara:strand:+ start:821 stop:3004 length:2184 start_codon:yes stop_codon:yes gene_type:complete
MAENVNNTIKTTVELDINQAQQEIVKLNSIASDGTKELSERLEAKNKQIEIQNSLNKKNIADLEKQVKGLKGVEGSEKKYEQAVKKLNKAKLNEVKVTERNAKQQRKLADSYKESRSAIGTLNKATGGFVDKLKLLAANPVILVMTALTATLALLKKAFTSSEKGQDTFAKGMAILDSVVGNLMDVVAGFAETLVDLFTNPVESIKGFASAFKENITNRISSSIELFGFLGSAIKKVFSGDFSGALEDAKSAGSSYIDTLTGVKDTINKTKDAVKGFTEAVIADGIVAGQIADQRANADRIERDLIVERAKANRDRAAALEKSVDKEKFTIKERIEFLKEAGRIEQEITDKEIIAAKVRLKAKISENALSNSNKEDLEEEARLKARIVELEFARLTKQKEVTGQIQAFSMEEISALKAVEAFKKGLIDTEDQTKLQKIEQEKTDREKALEDLKISEEAKSELLLDIDKRFREDKRKLKEEEDLIDAEIQLESDEFDLQRKREFGTATLGDELLFLEKQREQDLSNKELTEKERDLINKKYNAKAKDLADLAEQQAKDKDIAILESALGAAAQAFGDSKALSVAGALINTYKGISEVWGAKSETGLVGAGLAQKVATTAIVAAQGFGTVKKIMSTNAPGVSSRGGGGGGGSISSVAMPTIPTATSSEVSDLSASNAARSGIDSSIGNQATQTASANVQAGNSGNVIFSESSYKSFQDQVTFKEDKSTL